ncbi:carotenoid 1,2-hydratase [uncultured Thiodictyon sp.]|uniref:carotenoid 1,2-hydratase n=1 Tax=uncultured Thiodictyon sp. TaxID=1846217 RepID=UPI0025DCE2C4|nr:carotenoid 1,2-hydratase [uncultured Thiodictyon sp.]
MPDTAYTLKTLACLAPWRELFRRAALLSLLATVVLLAGCATQRSIEIPYNDKTHRNADYEWSPHDQGSEWWYLTGQLADRSGKSYFYQITIFRSFLVRQRMYLGATYALHLSFTDPSTGQHLFSEEVRLPSARVYADGHCIVFEDSRVCRDGQGFKIAAKSKNLRFNLVGEPTKAVVWHGRDGRIVMGHPRRPAERSYYYSYTNIDTAGTLAFKSPNNDWVTIEGAGKSWFDRQWGLFTETGWEWFSLRFVDGEEIMLYAFPKTGHQEGTYIDRAGRTTIFDRYHYRVTRVGRFSRLDRFGQLGQLARFDDKKFGLGWTLSVPVKDRRYRIVPLVDRQFNPSKLMPYWEGLCKVLDSSGALVGYAVVETPGSAY